MSTGRGLEDCVLGRDEGGEQETGLDAVSPRWHPAPAAEAGTCAPKRLPQARLRSDEEGQLGTPGRRDWRGPWTEKAQTALPGLLSTGVSVPGAEGRWGQGREEGDPGRRAGDGSALSLSSLARGVGGMAGFPRPDCEGPRRWGEGLAGHRGRRPSDLLSRGRAAPHWGRQPCHSSPSRRRR